MHFLILCVVKLLIMGVTVHLVCRYMATLELEEVKANVLRYGSVLLNHVPDETTELLISLCTDYKPSNSPIVKEVRV